MPANTPLHIAYAAAAALTFGCAAGSAEEPPGSQDASLEAALQDQRTLEQRIIELAHSQAEAQNESDRQRTRADRLEQNLENMQEALQEADESVRLAATALETLIACLNAQQNWIALLSANAGGDRIPQTTADRAASEMNAACTSAQKALEEMRGR